MTPSHRIAILATVATLAACADRSPNPVTPDALDVHRAVTDACPGLGDGCIEVASMIDVAAVDVGDSYIESSAGTRYYVAWDTQFLPVVLPPSPIFPNDAIHATVLSWNALVESRSSYRSFLGQLRQLPPSPILPPNPIRFRATALFDGTSYFLESLQPVLAEEVGT